MNSNKLVLLKDVEEIVSKWYETTDGDKYARYIYASRSEILQEILSSLSSLPTQNEWIPVSERFPEPDTDIMVSYRGFNDILLVHEVSTDCERDWRNLDFYLPSVGIITDKVTHWMPLPLPPIYNKVDLKN